MLAQEGIGGAKATSIQVAEETLFVLLLHVLQVANHLLAHLHSHVLLVLLGVPVEVRVLENVV